MSDFSRPHVTRPQVSRRALLGRVAGAGLAIGIGALSPQLAAAADAAQIEREVDEALADLYATVPNARELYDRALAVLVIPNVIKAGFIVGGAYGEGALRIGGRTDSYWAYGAGSLGFQIGAQKTRQALFFMTDDALRTFLAHEGVEVGADLEVTLLDEGVEAGIDTTTEMSPTIAITYSRKGLLGGASIAGGKYTRLIR
ncbi:MAG: lipid-binding SYLF domain-containing protein [Neomegalonema sp.]|nr:lipid-binding SYLF domain-containing protein [Neomegalonema sp.]